MERQKWRKALGFIIIALFFACSANAQISGKSIPQLRQELQQKPLPFIIPSIHLVVYPFSFNYFPKTLHNSTPIPNYYDYNKLAFFCKVEVKLEKAVKLPIKFRLGEVEYVDRLEGKRE